jgi:hypothetical protein
MPAGEHPGFTRALDLGPAVALLGAAVVAALLAAIYGLRIRGIVIFDETLNVVGGRYIDHHFPQALFQPDGGVFQRGPERLSALLLATSNLLSRHTATQIEIAHIVFAIAYAAAAIPTYAMARLLGLGRWWAAAAGALVVCTPLLLFGATLLNTSLSLLTASIALWAYLRCLVAPGWRTDALAVLATGLMATARVSYGGLGLALVIAVALQAWRAARGGSSRSAASQLLRDHWLLLGVAGAVVAYLLVHGMGQASGYAGVSAMPSLSAIWDHMRLSMGQLAVAYALAPFAIAIAWVLRSALRPGDRATGAFAVLVLACFLVLSYINQDGDLETRYIVALLPLAAVAVVAPFARRELRSLEVAVAGLLVARAVATTQSTQALGGFVHFWGTTDAWYANAWLGRTTLYTGLSASTADTALTLAAALLAVALAALSRRAGRRWPWIAGAVLVATAVAGFAGAWYSAAKLVPSLPGLSTDDPALHPRDFSQAAFVDEHVHAPVGVLDYLTHEPGLPQQWTAIEMFNGRVQATVRVNRRSSGYTCCSNNGALFGLTIEQDTGVVTVTGGTLPRYLLSTTQWMPGGLVTEPIVTSPVTDPTVSLVRTVLPLRVAWTGPGVPADGWGAPGQTLRLRVFPTAPVNRRQCLNVALTAPSIPDTGTLGVSAGALRVSIRPGETALARLPLMPGDRRAQDVLIRTDRSGIRSDGARVTVGLSNVHVGPCAAQAGP